MRHFLAFCLLFLARIVVAQADYYIKFPDDLITTSCNSEEYLTPPQLFNTNGANITIEHTDAQITWVNLDACFKIERTWYVKSANYNPALSCISVPNPNPLPDINHPDNLPGPIVSPFGTPVPWSPTITKLGPADPLPTDFSTYWSATANCYAYTQNIKVTDLTAPSIFNCPTDALHFVDNSANDPQLWNAPYWFNSTSNTNDLSDGAIQLSILANDLCAYSGNIVVRYLLFLDLDQDGVMETVINSVDPPAAGQVNYGNYSNPGYIGGTPQYFDQRTLSADLKYRFGMQATTEYFGGSSDPYRRAMVGWHSEQAPGNWLQPQLPAGTHKIRWMVGDDCGNESVCEYTFTVFNAADYHTLRGKIQTDDNLNCSADANEVALQQNWKVRLDRLNNAGAIIDTDYSSIGTNYEYSFLVDTSNYHLSALPPNDYFSPCYDSLLTINTIGTTSEINFAVQLTADCPFLETDIGTPTLRRCFDNTYTVRYCNTGTADAENAFIRVKLDPFMSFVSSQLPAVFEGNQIWRFDLGEIPISGYGSFTLVAYVDCDSTVIGQTHCVEAHIYPDSFCLVPPGWSGANVAVDGICQTDSVRFMLHNTGTATTSLLEYIVIEDNIITRRLPFQLLPGGSMPISVPANGSTWRLQAEQEPGNPYNPTPSATVEACGQNSSGGVSIGFVSQFGESDGDPFVSIDCQASTGSYDPNDKQGYPLGYGDDHLIEPGQPLDYMIRFQNTGTDTAFTVVVKDTLAAWLNPASMVPGASSQPYRFILSEAGLLTFRFENILLPDSNVNEMASHGFVKFRVRQRDSIPLGTVITNRAAIYFDFNEPVMTNETQHQVGEKFVTSGVQDWIKSSKLRPIRVSPNPAPSGAMLHFENLAVSSGRFDLYDARGQFVLSRPLSGNQVSLQATNLPTGIYFFKIFAGNKMQGVGKLSIIDKT